MIKFNFELNEEDASSFLEMLYDSILSYGPKIVHEMAQSRTDSNDIIKWYEAREVYERELYDKVVAGMTRDETKEN